MKKKMKPTAPFMRMLRRTPMLTSAMARAYGPIQRRPPAHRLGVEVADFTDSRGRHYTRAEHGTIRRVR